MNARGTRRRAAMVALLLVSSTPLASAHTFFSVSRADGALRRIDITSLATAAQQPITVSGQTVSAGHALARDRGTGELYALVLLPGGATSSLILLDPFKAEGMLIGDTGHDLAALTVDGAGTLWAVSSDSDSTPEALYQLDAGTGAATFRLDLGAGDPGEGLGFHPGTGLLYHASGDTTPRLETIHPVTLVRTPVTVTGGPWGETSSVVWDDESAKFLVAGRDRLVKVTLTGVVLDPGVFFDHDVHGLAGFGCSDTHGAFGSFCGDCNLDGSGPDVLDALAAAQIHVGTARGGAVQDVCCDVNTDRQVSILDGLVMAQWAAGLPATLSCAG